VCVATAAVWPFILALSFDDEDGSERRRRLKKASLLFSPCPACRDLDHFPSSSCLFIIRSLIAFSPFFYRSGVLTDLCMYKPTYSCYSWTYSLQLKFAFLLVSDSDFAACVSLLLYHL